MAEGMEELRAKNPLREGAPEGPGFVLTPARRPHPPTSPGPIDRGDEGRIWPPLVGIAVLVLQGFGLLSSVGSALMQFMDIQSMLGGFAPRGAFESAEKWKPVMLAMYGVAGTLALVAIVGGAMLLLRRRWGVRLLVGWAILRLPYGLASSWAVAGMQRDNMASMSGPGFGAGGPPGMSSVIVIMSVVTSLLMSMALPIFLLIWFALPRIRRQVRGWK